MFEAFPKLTRFSHDWVVTEKIDGTNAQIVIVPLSEVPEESLPFVLAHGGAENPLTIFAGSRSRLLTTGSGDNHGFAGFVQQNAEEIIAKLGEGRHYGEWYGSKIGPRKYGLDHKRFALFNATRWTGADLPERFDVVPTIFKGRLESTDVFEEALQNLKAWGSLIAPGFMNPEGIVMYHGPSKSLFKKTFDYDEAGKWAEKLDARG